MSDDQSVGPAVTLGLLAAWAVHDAEEIALMPRFLRKTILAVYEPEADAPEWVRRAVASVDGRDFAAAVGVMGVVVAAASADGLRTGGRSAFYQATLIGFGLHGVTHLVPSVAFRGYSPGVVTAPLVVIPFSLWAHGRLRRAGVARPVRARDAVLGLAGAAAATVASHVVARRLVRSVRRRRTAREPIA